MKIFITGCAKSGTTLLQRCMSAFNGVTVVPEEISLEEFVDMPDKGILVAKRTSKNIFSNSLSPDAILAQLRMIHSDNIKIINIVRDGRDTVLSDNHAVLPPRWTSSATQSRNLRGFIGREVYYEHLCNAPDLVQEEIATYIGLDHTYKFSEYPKFVPENLIEGEQLYKPRPISTESIGKDKGAYVDLCMDDERIAFERCLKNYNYIGG